MNTELGEKITLDWISLTLPGGEKNVDKAINWFVSGIPKIEDYGMLGYTKSIHILDGGRILWNPEKIEMGVHVILNSVSLSLLGMTPIGLIEWCEGKGGSIKRMDLAFDDFGGLLDIDEMYRKILSGELQTRFRRATRIDGANVGENKKTGFTVNLGRRSSESFIRIYDKHLERVARGEERPEGEKWVRVELELKGKKADAFAKLLLSEDHDEAEYDEGQLCSMLLLGLLDFKTVSMFDENKSRWPTSHWWMKFVGVQEKLCLRVPKVEKTLEDTKRWIRVQVATSLALIVLSHDDDDGITGYDFIINCIADGETRMSKRQSAVMDAYNAKFDTEKSETDIPG